MGKILLAVCSLLIVTVVSICWQYTHPPLSNVLFRAARSTVLINTDQSLGTGVVISSSGLIITAAHVVDPIPEEVIIYFQKPSRPCTATILRTEERYDLALLQLQACEAELIPMPLFSGMTEGTYADLIGSRIFAIGHPQDLRWTVTAGIVSQIRFSRSLASIFFVQYDAATNPGNSGGPLINEKGELVGIVSRIFSLTEQNAGLNLAVPSIYVRWMLDPTTWNYPKPTPMTAEEQLLPAP